MRWRQTGAAAAAGSLAGSVTTMLLFGLLAASLKSN